MRNSISIFKTHKVRTFLTIVGIIIATTVYLVVNVYADALISTLSDIYEGFDSHTILIRDYLDKNALKEIKARYEKENYSCFNKGYTVNIHIADDNVNFDVEAELTFVKLDFHNYSLPSIDRYDGTERTKILYGRAFNQDDLKDEIGVTIIHSGFAKLLFGDNNPLGQYIKTDTSLPVKRYMVVGILSDTPDVLRTIDTYNKWQAGLKDEKTPFVPLYTPVEYGENKWESADDTIITFRDSDNVLGAWYNIRRGMKWENAYTRESVFNEISESTKEFAEIVNLIVLVIMLTTGLSLSIILIFSFKERLPEIGIKKALGANDGVILFQFFIENIVMGLLGALCGLAVGLFVLITTAPFALQTTVVTMFRHITWDRLLVPILMSASVTSAFGFIPSLWGVKQNIMSVLRYE